MVKFEDSLIFLARQPLMQEQEWCHLLQAGQAGTVVEDLAKTGSARASLQWGRMLLCGVGVAKDETAAFAWFQTAANQEKNLDSAAALNMMGRCYEHGWGIEINLIQAFVCYTQASQQGDFWALFNLGDCYRKGRGCLLDKQKAVQFYKQAADQGHIKSLNMLGLAFEEGEGVAPNLEVADEYFARGAQAGDCWAAFNHARLLMGRGEREASLAWLEKSLANHSGDYCQAFAAMFMQSQNEVLYNLAVRAQKLWLEQMPKKENS